MTTTQDQELLNSSLQRRKFNKQIDWYESKIKELKQANHALLMENATVKYEYEELNNLLFVLTRSPEELEEVRKRWRSYPQVNP